MVHLRLRADGQLLSFISERLEMGHISRVSQAISQIKQRPSVAWEQLKQRLLRVPQEEAVNRKERKERKR
jgi:hypothetical protein